MDQVSECPSIKKLYVSFDEVFVLHRINIFYMVQKLKNEHQCSILTGNFQYLWWIDENWKVCIYILNLLQVNSCDPRNFFALKIKYFSTELDALVLFRVRSNRLADLAWVQGLSPHLGFRREQKKEGKKCWPVTNCVSMHQNGFRLLRSYVARCLSHIYLRSTKWVSY